MPVPGGAPSAAHAGTHHATDEATTHHESQRCIGHTPKFEACSAPEANVQVIATPMPEARSLAFGAAPNREGFDERSCARRVTMVEGRRGHAMATLTLKPGHVQPVWAGHPWVYEQAIHRIEGGAVAGDEVDVLDPRGNFIGRGFYSPGSAIPVRVLARDRDTPIDVELFRTRIERAMHRRRA